MKIPEEKIDEIRNTVSIVDYISGFVPLRKRGKNFIGLCPFHNEKTPSFTVSEEKQIYHCFGCHAGGNVFKFLMEYKSISFIEAITEVADYLGIEIKAEKGNYKEIHNEHLYDVNLAAAKYFSKTLLDSIEGEYARDYLSSRNIKTQTQRIFGLGYSPDKWDALLNHLKKEKVNLDHALELGLIDTKTESNYYDKYKGRLIFPIFSTNGRIIGFGGRVLQNDLNTAKYLNSPESKIYLKRKSLYGLYHSKDEIRKKDRAIIVEGYMDLIALFQGGIKNVVASSGTSLTDDQVTLLSRFTKNVTVLFDADTAGHKAAIRSIEILLKQDFDVKIVSLPSNEDPDSFINKFGKEEFEDKLLKAKNFLEYKVEQYKLDGSLDDPSSYTDAVRDLVKTIAVIDDSFKRGLLINSISKKFNLREKLIEDELNKFLSSKGRAAKLRPSIKKLKAEAENHAPEPRASKSEIEILRLLLSGNEEIMDVIFDNIHPDEFLNEKVRFFVNQILLCYKKNEVSPAKIIESFEDVEVQENLRKLTMVENPISSKWEDPSSGENIEMDSLRYAGETVRKFRINKIETLIKENNEKIPDIADPEELKEIFMFNADLKKEINELKENI